MFAKLARFANDVIGLIYPSKCLICGETQTSSLTHLLCENCLAEIASQPLPAAETITETRGELPGGELDEVHAGWFYDTTMQIIIHAFKYRRRPSLSRVLGNMLAQRLHDDLTPKISRAVLVPVPLHRRRGRHRGFNQSILLAQTVAQAWNMTVLPRGLERTRFTKPQAKLDAAARLENVKDAFALASKSNLQGLTVLLVDDVLTTGATMNACAAVLKSAGATRVIGLALAKAGQAWRRNQIY
ncbi:MAG: phosphoribosyltransferase family protein [candidate division KSB1 bacterium]|nr:phosphoribosyltransferase family protein [candidate division KSB1 bacterium]MDZ7364913.1 phosphoribosyltransferase family protein [candidate division KSB1 bacterium]MDZ7403015.1 phosphoribosyltransferase family protein [candidate division KSB1 bacterium]